MSRSTESGDTTAKTPVEDALERYFASLTAGGTENTLRWVLADGEHSFLAYLEANGTEFTEQIDVEHCRDWGMELKTRVATAELAASTAHTYFNYLRAFLSFCVRDQLLETNPAQTDAAQEFLPEDTGERDRQFWGQTERNAILDYAHERADRSHDDDSIDTVRAYRDRAIVTLLALAGVRGAEIFRDPNDDRRDGITWTDVDLERAELEVFGKSREFETIGLPSTAQTALERYRAVYEPPAEDWPVFPTGHYNSKRRELIAAYDEERVTQWLENGDERTKTAALDTLLREQEVSPPTLSKNGGRSVMKRLCEDANIDIDGEYLKPHGGRRGLGHELYASGHSEYAQQALRHKSIETTHEAYSDIKNEEIASVIDDVVDGNQSARE